LDIAALKQFQQMSLPPLQPSNVEVHAFGNHIFNPSGKAKVKSLTSDPKLRKIFLVMYGVIGPPETLYLQHMRLFFILIAL